MSGSAPGALSPLISPAEAERIRALAVEILERPDYENVHAADLPNPMIEIMKRLFDLFGEMQMLHAESPLIYWAVFFGLTVVALLLITHIVWSISRAMRDSAEVPTRQMAAPAADWVGAARELARDGRFLEATHRLLLATLRRIARKGLIDLGPGDTNREVCARLMRADLPDALGVELVSLVRATERAWFRDRRDDPDLYRRWTEAYARLEAQTGG